MRRAFNVVVGPFPRPMVFKRPADADGRQHIYLVPIPAVLRWYADPGLHFNKVGLIEVDWLAYTVGTYWHDNDPGTETTLSRKAWRVFIKSVVPLALAYLLTH